MRIECYITGQDAPELIPAKPNRTWQNEFAHKHPNKCLPMLMANSHGYELQCPETVYISWNGGDRKEDVSVHNTIGQKPHWVESHFAGGTVTFHPGYLFRTEKDWAIHARGKPNEWKDGIHALEGITETDWLTFTFTMNWRFTRPCTVMFERGECYCFITPIKPKDIECVQPYVCKLEDNPLLNVEYKAWCEDRDKFNKAIEDGCPHAIEQGWRKHYTKGQKVTGDRGDFDHTIKRRLKKPLVME